MLAHTNAPPTLCVSTHLDTDFTHNGHRNARQHGSKVLLLVQQVTHKASNGPAYAQYGVRQVRWCESEKRGSGSDLYSRCCGHVCTWLDLLWVVEKRLIPIIQFRCMSSEAKVQEPNGSNVRRVLQRHTQSKTASETQRGEGRGREATVRAPARTTYNVVEESPHLVASHTQCQHAIQNTKRC